MKVLCGLVNGQVLQRLGSRGASLQLSGESQNRGEVLATIFQNDKPLNGWKARRVGLAAKGTFTAKLTGIPSGGPYRLSLAVGNETVAIKSFYVGDVWVLAGQSNMEGVGNLDQPAKPHPLIRAFSMRREWKQARDPLHTLGESPDEAHHGGRQWTVQETASSLRTRAKGVGVGVFFAQEMLRRSGVPQGLICTAHGGTSMAQWNPRLKAVGGKSIYYSMLASVKATEQPVAGVLWYQGESDCGAAEVPVYGLRMNQLVAATRRDFRQAGLPWIIVQLGRHVAVGEGEHWNAIQELQRTLPSKIRRLETVSARDLSLDDGIHISSEGLAQLGIRLASSAARLVLGDKRELPQPQLLRIYPLQNFTGRGWIQEVEFTGIKGKLVAGGEPHGFSYLNAEHRSVPIIYRTTLHGNRVRLHLTSHPGLSELRIGYGLGLNELCNIRDERGFSLPAFGPLEITKPRATLPFITQWRVTDVLPATRKLEKLKSPNLKVIPHEVRRYQSANNFIDEHARWLGKTGQVFFAATVELPERMDLKLLFGYDGPFRLWVDGKPVFIDLFGTNPAMVDAKNKSLILIAGRHEIKVAMDVNQGKAFGFFMRCERNGISLKQIRAKEFSQPIYSV